MTEPPSQETQIQFLLSDFNTRLKDIEERNKAVRERVLLLGKNLINSKERNDQDLEDLKKQSAQDKKDIEKLKSLMKNILKEIDKYVRKDEIIVIERMLKDFQPLEFMREKDVVELINEKIKTNKN